MIITSTVFIPSRFCTETRRLVERPASCQLLWRTIEFWRISLHLMRRFTAWPSNLNRHVHLTEPWQLVLTIQIPEGIMARSEAVYCWKINSNFMGIYIDIHIVISIPGWWQGPLWNITSSNAASPKWSLPLMPSIITLKRKDDTFNFKEKRHPSFVQR